jgi:PAS domain S-box-containing protein
MTSEELKHLGVILSAFGAIGTAMIFVSRYMYRGGTIVSVFLSDFGKMPSRISGLADAYKELCKRVGAIENELKPHGGTSLRDAVTRVEQMTIGTRAHVRLQYQMNLTPTFEIGTDGSATWVNRAYIEEYGMGLDDISGNKWLSNIHPDDRERVMKEYAHIIEDKRQGSIQYRAQFKGEPYRNMDIIVYPIFDHESACLGWVGYSKMLPRSKA